MDLHFSCKLGGKGLPTVLIGMKNNNMSWCAPTREGREFGLTAVIGEGELVDFEFNRSEVTEDAEFLLIAQ